ncbi:23S rRNA m(2)G-2445 methyltransferase [Sulfurivirga caldicuralii]|uniref:Ribosomal RNA large subunit methyltransferase K/L n=1 Tax=Sulfurivirga caldicuralii TaxID=364032 RepID=A0A1N6DQA4_9GAMM|nr:bifunctional 23S rRNA (guanine(2069)-N(7))-methyltransferase RlmK/23S rRNA (guanine(2445)-N(2))-methyltransferase RlmL [Sulfurivirga caldicuralii]SIN72854.1 23S rRNA m(2)G-2445 methyltransferase [Sulfurivirga caldicuralii]
MVDARYFATAPAGALELLRDELKSLGATSTRLHGGGVAFSGAPAVGYGAALWSRTANRVYLQLAAGEVHDGEDLYALARSVDWSEHLAPDTPFAVSFTGTSSTIRHTHFGALKIKDALVDCFRDRGLPRPSVSTDSPHLALHAHLHRNQAVLYLDLVGFGMHQRGYRAGARIAAPLKENVAAAVLLRAGWPRVAEAGGALLDPMCGSATFLIEGAWLAADRAPLLDRAADMSLTLWRQHDKALWQRLVADARTRAEQGLAQLDLPIVGRDIDPRSLKAAKHCVAQAGLRDKVLLQQGDVRDARPSARQGLVVCNPPYGERLAEKASVGELYRALGDTLRQHFVRWQAALFTCNADAVKQVGLRPLRSHAFRNGALECQLYRYAIDPEHFRHPPLETGLWLARAVAERYPQLAHSPGAQAFANRVRKNLKRLRRWLKQEGVQAFRVYDADMPEYALAVDVYDTLDDGRWVVVYEYAPPRSVDERKVRQHRFEALAALPGVLDVPADKVVYKVRQRQKGRQQYEKLAATRDFHQVLENGARLWVNFVDYLDTGLFLDHRWVRREVAKLSAGKRLLNLFCYTASASVEAAVAGARETLSVDMSRTYLEWARMNLDLNGLDADAHRLERADVLRWLQRPPRSEQGRFDVVFLDPPSFSTSKRMEGTLDIQRDHVRLIEQARALLKPSGTLIFSTNLRGFKLDETALVQHWQVQEITRETLPPDFERNARIHRVWRLQPE